MVRFAPVVRSALVLAALAVLAPQARASAASRPAAPCAAPPLAEPIATRFAQLGGVRRFGCFVGSGSPSGTVGEVEVFRAGRIASVPLYGAGATYAAVVDGDRVVHLYLEGVDPKFAVDRWLVRLSFDGSLVNQVTYKAGSGDVGGTYFANVLVHPGDRRGTFEIATEGCFTAPFASSTCMGWDGAVFRMDL